MIEAWINAYAWDLDDEGVDGALARLAGDIGLNGITIGALHPPVSYFRARPSFARRLVKVEGGAAFQPDTKRYGASRLRPHPAGWCRSRNPLEAIARGCERAGMRLRARLSALNSVPPGKSASTCVGALGDAIEPVLCSADPAVREYLLAVAEDLSENHPLAALVLSEFDYEPLTRACASLRFMPTAVERMLMGWCFCAACRQRAADAGLDAAAIARQAAERLDAAAAGEASVGQTPADFLAAREECAAFVRVREQAVRSLIAAIRGRIRCPLVLSAPLDRWESGSEITALAASADAWVVPAPPSTAAWREFVRRTASGIAASHTHLTWSPIPPATPDAPTLVKALNDALRSGYSQAAFDHFGIVPDACLDWIRQALRYARRESGAT